MASEGSTEGETPRRFRKRDVMYWLAVTFIGLFFGLFHLWHVTSMFENDRKFSFLSEIEREMSLRTEMGMYYSYYKTIAESKSIIEGLNKVSHDNISEYGNVINAARRYSLMPELLIGILYHLVKDTRYMSKGPCWSVERREGSSPVISCEGMGEPIYFYLEVTWFTTMFTAMLLFKYSVYLSDSVWGGLITILLFFYNHNECTRVQWTPNLRETYAYPLLLAQMFGVTEIIRTSTEQNAQKLPKSLLISVIVTTMMSLCTWQFSHFILTTQIVVLLILKWMRIIPNDLYKRLCVAHGWAILLAAFFTNVNMLCTSLYACLLVTSGIVMYLQKISNNFAPRLETSIEILWTIVLVKCLKSYVTVTEDDTHVFNLLRAKLTGYKDFHTMLYTCQAEFDYLPYKTYEAIVKTLLLPTAILTGMLVLYFWYRCYRIRGYPLCIEADVAYNGLQTGVFIVMAVLIMRLKLFMNPHLCILAGTVCAKRYLEKVGVKSEMIRSAFIVLLIAGMSHHGIERFQEERNLDGDFTDLEQEELFEWIKNNTAKNSVFAGKMSLMANLMLSTRRPIVNNPYYENKEMRDRTMKVYEVYSRKDPVSVYFTLRSMKVDYVILDDELCLGYSDNHSKCQMVDLWDVVDNGTAKAAGKPPLCPQLFLEVPYPFSVAFVNDYYVVLQLDYSYYVELKPKTSDTLLY